jgi:hypothetical protein
MNNLGPWSTEDFEQLSWHDIHVHGIKLEEFQPDNGSADLLLDIDYILKWEQSGTALVFTVSQALLRFHQVFGLRLTLDYKTPTAGMSPFSISGIEREPIESVNGVRSFRWRLPINWPTGLIEFEAPSFRQRLVGPLHIQSEQSLDPSKRHHAPDA